MVIYRPTVLFNTTGSCQRKCEGVLVCCHCYGHKCNQYPKIYGSHLRGEMKYWACLNGDRTSSCDASFLYTLLAQIIATEQQTSKNTDAPNAC